MFTILCGIIVLAIISAGAFCIAEFIEGLSDSFTE